MRLGIIAPEFPPAVGGMPTLAHGMACALAATDDVTVFPFHARDRAHAGAARIERPLSGALFADASVLRVHETNVDVWLLLNAGLVPIAPMLDKPAFAYLHGNDFLTPWIGYGSWWLEPVRRPYAAKIRNAIRRGAVRRAMKSLRHVFTNSRRTAEIASERLGLPASRIAVCPPGVDDCFFQSHEARQDSALRLLTVARLTKHSARKNVDGVLMALTELRGRLRVHYEIVGDGDDRPRLEALAQRLGLADNVSFLGSLEARDLLACYRRADLFVLACKATREDVEGFGIVYLEACASGVPVICSKEGGAVDAVEPGRNGMVLSGSSPAEIAEAISAFADARARWTSDSVRAFAENYRWPACAARLRGQMMHAMSQTGSRLVGAPDGSAMWQGAT